MALFTCTMTKFNNTVQPAEDCPHVCMLCYVFMYEILCECTVCVSIMFLCLYTIRGMNAVTAAVAIHCVLNNELT